MSVSLIVSCTKNEAADQATISMPEENNPKLRHTFIADGYKRMQQTYTYVYKSMDEETTEFKYINYDGTETSEYITLNWGYDGIGDRNSSGGLIWYNLGNTYLFSGSSNPKTYTGLNDARIIYGYINLN